MVVHNRQRPKKTMTSSLVLSEMPKIDEVINLENQEVFWNSMEAQVRQDLIEILVKWSRSYQTETDEEKAELFESMLSSEKKFVTQILSKIQHVSSKDSSKGLQVLFDIDETLASAQYTSNNFDDIYTIFRPSAIPVIKFLRSLKARVGLLTSRGQLTEQLDDPNMLGPISGYVDRVLVYSSRTYDGEDSMDFIKGLKQKFGGKTGIIDDSLVENDNLPHDIGIMGNQSKLMLIQDIKDEFKGKSVVIVDDFSFPRILNEEVGLYGISLSEGG